MKRTLCLCALACLLAGCTSDPYAACPAGPAKPATVKSNQAMGGLDNWHRVASIRATAIVTDYVNDVGAITQQQQVYDLQHGTLTANGVLPQGSWQATVWLDGRRVFDQSTDKTVAWGDRVSLASSMLTSLRRAYGTLRLCNFGPTPCERATSYSVERLFGTDYIRVGVKGGAEGVRAFYLDMQSYLPVYVTVGADEPGGAGTVARYHWAMLDNGIAFPSSIEVYNIGQDVLVGYKRLLEVEFRDLSVELVR